MALTLSQLLLLVTLLIAVPVLGNWAFHRLRRALVRRRRVSVSDHIVEPVLSDRVHSIGSECSGGNTAVLPVVNSIRGQLISTRTVFQQQIVTIDQGGSS